MLKKEKRANKQDLDRVFKRSPFLNSLNLTFRYIKGQNTKISFIVPKSVSKKAVIRNSLRRIGYVLLEKNLKSLPFPVVGAFVFKKNIKEGLENEIQSILSKIN